jgi:hypothetical protein
MALAVAFFDVDADAVMYILFVFAVVVAALTFYYFRIDNKQ